MIRIGTSLEIGCSAYALQHPQISALYQPAAASCFCHHRNFSTRSIRNDAGRKISAGNASHNSRTPETQQEEAGGEADRRAHHVLAEARTLEVPTQALNPSAAAAQRWNIEWRSYVKCQLLLVWHVCTESRELQEGKKREQQAFILVVWWIDGCSASWLAG